MRLNRRVFSSLPDEDEIAAVDFSRGEIERLKATFMSEAEAFLEPAGTGIVLPDIDRNSIGHNDFGRRQCLAQRGASDAASLIGRIHIEPADFNLAGALGRAELGKPYQSAPFARQKHTVASEVRPPGRNRNCLLLVVG